MAGSGNADQLGAWREFLQQTLVPIRLACMTRQGWPMVLSLWYLYEGGKLYCATQKTAKLVFHLENNRRCGFEIAADQPPYRGLRGQGEVALIDSLGAVILGKLIDRYLPRRQSAFAERLLARSENEVAIEIRPLRIFTWDYRSRMGDAL